MKVLVTFQKVVSFIISRNEFTNTKNSRFHNIRYILKWIGFYILFCLAFILLSIFLFVEADSFEEVTETFYSLSSVIFCTAVLTQLISNRRKLFALIDHFEETIDKSKLKLSTNDQWVFLKTNLWFADSENPASNTIYKSHNEIVEKLSKFAYFTAVQIWVPGIAILYMVVSYYLWFYTDSGPDSFYLPFTFW